MKLFGTLITASSLTSFLVGVYTNDIFNSFALYTPLAVLSWAVSEWFNGRKNYWRLNKMKVKEKNKLSKVVQVLEKVLDEKDKEVFLSAKDRFHSITGYQHNDTAFYEHILKLVHKELFNILGHLEFDSQELETIDEVTFTLGAVINEKQETYNYSVTDNKGTADYTTDREGHIIGILEWALDYIVGNIEVEEME